MLNNLKLNNFFINLFLLGYENKYNLREALNTQHSNLK